MSLRIMGQVNSRCCSRVDYLDVNSLGFAVGNIGHRYGPGALITVSAIAIDVRNLNLNWRIVRD